MKIPQFVVLTFVATLLVSAPTRPAWAQLLGVELNNTVMPASGGMGGTSVARPHDQLGGRARAARARLQVLAVHTSYNLASPTCRHGCVALAMLAPQHNHTLAGSAMPSH